MIVQSISLLWGKKTRGAPYSTLRNQYNKSFSIPESMINYKFDSKIPFQKIDLIQNDQGIIIKNNKVEYVDANLCDWKIGCTEIQRKEELLLVFFKYTNYCGKPIRYDSKHNYLSEKAFELNINEYGRIIYNGRLVNHDTGEWIYQLNILNVYNSNCNNKEVLVEKMPLKEYKQLEILF
ncbi:hypothetical protein RQP52_35685 [Paenibacillus sp. PFR10]|uniref:YopX protein domain-containing protein n=2 Tax=Paenibacillus TaxID=44249 RepID=A0ABU3RQ20_9BACL|nr:hypothetical protein [Paenibacillus sp. PFR10]MDU0206411.1 hypothetical protein [Paenibacillus sp. PFR10]